jgi:hypothetical protein
MCKMVFPILLGMGIQEKEIWTVLDRQTQKFQALTRINWKDDGNRCQYFSLKDTQNFRRALIRVMIKRPDTA